MKIKTHSIIPYLCQENHRTTQDRRQKAKISIVALSPAPNHPFTNEGGALFYSTRELLKYHLFLKPWVLNPCTKPMVWGSNPKTS